MPHSSVAGYLCKPRNIPEERRPHIILYLIYEGKHQNGSMALCEP